MKKFSLKRITDNWLREDTKKQAVISMRDGQLRERKEVAFQEVGKRYARAITRLSDT